VADPARRRAPERGSVLLLFPAAVLIMLVLSAITVDTSVAFLGQRELANATAAAANDASGRSVDTRAFYRDDRIELDAVAVEAVAVERVRLALDQSRHRGLDIQVTASPPAEPGCPWTVRVSASARVQYVFAKAIPGGPDEATVRATSVAGPEQADVTAGCGV
jgi:Flp pilus assembly protein TadG